MSTELQQKLLGWGQKFNGGTVKGGLIWRINPGLV
jgi:hypothetical protein